MSKTTDLYEAVSFRESCRRFACAPSTQQWNTLLAAADQLALSGVRIALGMCDTSLFQPFLGLLMKFENVQRFAAVITTDDRDDSAVNAGISGEMLMLTAVAQGLGGVWVAGTYKHQKVEVPLGEGERIRALIALGVPEKPPVPPLRRKRKELSQICSSHFADAPGVFKEVGLAVQAAPSAMNLQPWRIAYEPDNTLTLSVAKPSQKLDLGIATCHALLALGRTQALFTLAEGGLTTRITL